MLESPTRQISKPFVDIPEDWNSLSFWELLVALEEVLEVSFGTELGDDVTVIDGCVGLVVF